MSQPYQLSLTEAVNEIAARRLSSLELVQSLHERIEQTEPRLQAWATLLIEESLALATQSDQKSSNRGALEGVPYGAKDIFDTSGVVTAAGSRIFANRIPDEDASCIRIAKQAGAILLGKTHTTEFADGDPAPSFNPWNLDHTPGGSSTGSGVAVAARMVPWAFGTQTVGSVLRPAAYNGIIGFKPTFGRISRIGVIPMANSFDHVGFLARTVDDMALLLKTFAGYDSNDPYSHNVPVDDYVEGLTKFHQSPKIGLIRGWFFEEADAATRLMLEETAQKFAKAGAFIEEVDLGVDLPAAYAAHRIMQESEMAAWHAQYYLGNESLYGPKVSVYLQNGFSHTAKAYVEASEFRYKVQRAASDLMSKVDVLLMPSVSAPPPKDRTQTGDTRFQSLWSFTGFPSISIPIGLSGEGLPLGAQLSCAPFNELKLLQISKWTEEILGLELVPPLLD